MAFLDDDAYAEPEWLAQLLARYEAGVGAVGGRARNGIAGEENEGLDAIGRLLDNGVLTGNFAADPGRDIEVDHLLGANMSVLRSAVERLGGIHDHYPGTCLREESDIALRMRKAGYRIIYTPDAVVLHVAGVYAKGRRFDTRYKYYGARNHMVLLAHTLGFRDPRTRNNVQLVARSAVHDFSRVVTAFGDPEKTTMRAKVKASGGGVVRAAVQTAGTVVGAVVAARLSLVGDSQGTARAVAGQQN